MCASVLNESYLFDISWVSLNLNLSARWRLGMRDCLQLELYSYPDRSDSLTLGPRKKQDNTDLLMD